MAGTIQYTDPYADWFVTVPMSEFIGIVNAHPDWVQDRTNGPDTTVDKYWGTDKKTPTAYRFMDSVGGPDMAFVQRKYRVGGIV